MAELEGIAVGCPNDARVHCGFGSDEFFELERVSSASVCLFTAATLTTTVDITIAGVPECSLPSPCPCKTEPPRSSKSPTMGRQRGSSNPEGHRGEGSRRSAGRESIADIERAAK